MTLTLYAIRFYANDPQRLAQFWAGVLRRALADDGVTLLPTARTEPRIRFAPTSEPKTDLGRAHFDLTSTSLEDQDATVQRALQLGGRHLDIGQSPEDEHVVLADPEGNEFCVIEPVTTSLPGAGSSERSTGTDPRRSATFGAARSGGRWFGIRTKRPPSSRRQAG